MIHGLVGLVNLGNTCYFNAAVHCLSHTQPLVDYFMSEVYSTELNVKNPLGTRGEVTKEFAKLVKGIWSTQKSLGIVGAMEEDEEQKESGNEKVVQTTLSPLELFWKVHKYKRQFEIGCTGSSFHFARAGGLPGADGVLAGHDPRGREQGEEGSG